MQLFFFLLNFSLSASYQISRAAAFDINRSRKYIYAILARKRKFLFFNLIVKETLESLNLFSTIYDKK